MNRAAVLRGIVVSCWQLLLAIGQVIGACVDQGTKDIASTASWRIPIAVNYFFVRSSPPEAPVPVLKVVTGRP